MSRRVLGTLALSTALLTGGAVPLLAPAHADACASWTDKAGDSTTNEMNLPETGDANLDILGVSFQTRGTDVIATIKVSKLAEDYSDLGDQFIARFTAAGSIVQFIGERTEAGDTARVSTLDGSNVGTAVPEFDVFGNTVTITATIAQVDKVAGKATTGIATTSLAATTANQVQGRGLTPYDSSLAPAGTTYVVGTDCDTPLPPALRYPDTGCFTFNDVTGDGTPTIQNQATPNDQDVDITEVALNSTPTELFAYIKVAKLAAKPANFTGDRFDILFKADTKSYTFSVGRFGVGRSVTTHPTRGQLAGTTNAGLKVRGAFDLAKNTVIIRIDRAALDTVNGAPIGDATTLTDVSAKSLVTLPTQYITADTAQAAAATDRVYKVGDNPCFAPPAAVLLNTGATAAQFTDAAALAAKLTAADGTLLAGRTVKFTIGSASVTATTDATGVATASLNPGLTAGARELVTSFAGDATASKTSLKTPFTVAAEKTKLALSVVKSGTKRTVTAKLTDDDGKPVAGQVVTWFVNGKKVSAPKTNAAGVVTLTSATATQTVKAVFAAVAGKYLAATAQTKV